MNEETTTNLSNKDRRKTLLEQNNPLEIDGNKVSDPVAIIREDRDKYRN